jgi:hypothetical protein
MRCVLLCAAVHKGGEKMQPGMVFTIGMPEGGGVLCCYLAVRRDHAQYALFGRKPRLHLVGRRLVGIRAPPINLNEHEPDPRASKNHCMP